MSRDGAHPRRPSRRHLVSAVIEPLRRRDPPAEVDAATDSGADAGTDAVPALAAARTAVRSHA